MKVFISGATGFVGGHITNSLIELGYEVLVLVRDRAKARVKFGDKVECLVGDVCDPSTFENQLVDVDCVIHAAGINSFWEADPTVYYRVNVEGTRNILQSALDKGVDKVVYISTLGVWGNISEAVLTEDTPFAESRFGIYFDSKFEAEKVATQLNSKGLPLVTLYPGTVVGPNDETANGQYLRNIARNNLPALVFPKAKLPYVGVRDVVKAVTEIVRRQDLENERFILANKTMELGEFTRLVCVQANVAAPEKVLNDKLALFLAKILTKIANLTKTPPLWGMTADQMNFLSYLVREGTVDGGKATKHLQFQYESVDEMLEFALSDIS